MFCDIIMYTLGQEGGENMARDMTEYEELATTFAASKLNPSFQPEIRVEIEAEATEPHIGTECPHGCCGKCGCGTCKCG